MTFTSGEIDQVELAHTDLAFPLDHFVDLDGDGENGVGARTVSVHGGFPHVTVLLPLL